MFYFKEIPHEGKPIDGYLYGWRANKLNLSTFELTSPLQGNTKWGTEEMKAKCIHGGVYVNHWSFHWWAMQQEMLGEKRVEDFTHDECPQDWCSCGFYTFDSLDSYLEEMDYKDSDEAIFLMTLVRMWGTIIQHETGYRSEFVKADTVFLPEQHEPFEQLILQSTDAVIEPIEHAIDYDRNLPTLEEYLSQGDTDG